METETLNNQTADDKNTSIWKENCVTAETDIWYDKEGEPHILPQRRMFNATYQFGPKGRGWGFQVKSYKLETITTKRKTTTKPDGTQIIEEEFKNALVFDTLLWWDDSGQIREIQQMIDIELFVGKDCFKKLQTEAQGKALAGLGFNSDFYEGKNQAQVSVGSAPIDFAEEKQENNLPFGNESNTETKDSSVNTPKKEKTLLTEKYLGNVLKGMKKADDPEKFFTMIKSQYKISSEYLSEITEAFNATQVS